MNVGAQNFGQFHNKKTLIASNQSTDDIIKAVQKHHKIYAPEYDKASEKFWTGDVEGTGKNLFDFLQKNIRYEVEPKDEQTIKSPAALMHQGYGDCKHYASFVAGIADSLRRKNYPIEVMYRYASYKPGKEPHHVFAVLVDEAGNQYWVDPVPPIKRFNERRQPIAYKDKSAGMAGIGELYSISGIGRRNPEKKKRRKARRAKRKAEGKGFFRKLTGAVKKVSMAPSRNSMLLLLKMNLFRLSSKLKSKMNQKPGFKEQLAKKWKQLGGNPKQLFKDIDRGVRVWNKHHKNRQISGNELNAADEMYGLNKYGWAYDSVYLDDVGFCVDCTAGRKPVNAIGQIGVAPAVGAAAIIAAAAPILGALASLLKKNGIDTNQMQSAGAEAENDMYQEEAAEADDEYQEQTAYEPGYGDDSYYPEQDDEEVYAADDVEDMEAMYGISAITSEDVQNTGTAAANIISMFKADPKKKAARQKKRATRRAKHGKAPAQPRRVKNKVVIKAIPLKGHTMPNGARVIEHGTPAWDQAVRASHGQGVKRGLTVNQVPQGGQGVSDFFNNVKQWANENPGLAIGGSVGVLLLTGVIPTGKKRGRR